MTPVRRAGGLDGIATATRTLRAHVLVLQVLHRHFEGAAADDAGRVRFIAFIPKDLHPYGVLADRQVVEEEIETMCAQRACDGRALSRREIAGIQRYGMSVSDV